MLVLATYVLMIAAALIASVFGVPALWIPCIVIAALLVLRIELVWALSKLVRINSLRLDEKALR